MCGRAWKFCVLSLHPNQNSPTRAPFKFNFYTQPWVRLAASERAKVWSIQSLRYSCSLHDSRVFYLHTRHDTSRIQSRKYAYQLRFLKKFQKLLIDTHYYCHFDFLECGLSASSFTSISRCHWMCFAQGEMAHFVYIWEHYYHCGSFFALVASSLSLI